MTAKGIANFIYDKASSLKFLSSINEKVIEEMVKDYAKEKCKEQKELCQKHFLDTRGYEDIKSAPEPDFE